MRTIKLLKVVIKNFRSFNNVEVMMPVSEGLRLLTGQNKIEPRLGANGAGKSSFWKAVEWCAYGNGRTSALLAWGSSLVEVETEWLVNDVQYIIKRYGPPMKMELDGKQVLQEEIDKVLGLDKTRFLHSVVFGQSVALFPDLSIGERGELLDQVLSLNIWQRAADKAGEKVNTLEKELQQKRIQLSFLKGKFEALKTIEAVDSELYKWEVQHDALLASLREQKRNWDSSLSKRLAELDSEYSNWEKEHKANLVQLHKDEENWKQETVEKAEAKVQEIFSLEAVLSSLAFEIENTDIGSPRLISILEEQKVVLGNKVAELQTVVLQTNFELDNCIKASKLWNEDKCPQCSQIITADKKKHELSCIDKVKLSLERTKKESEKNLSIEKEQLQNCQSQLVDLQISAAQQIEAIKGKKLREIKLKQEVEILEREANNLINQVSGSNPYTVQIAQVQKQTNPCIQYKLDLQKAVNPYVDQVSKSECIPNPFLEELAKLKIDREKLETDHTQTKNEYAVLESTMLAAQYWRHGFKRIRLYFIQQVLAALQIEVQAAVNALGLDKWKISFTTESVTKSETIKLGIQIHISSPISDGEWAMWSGGEAQRLRRAIAIGLASLIQRAAGVSYQLEVWDEPTACLSPQGVEDLLETLQYRADALQKQVWVVDHSALTYSGFNEIWCAVKDHSGSKITMLSES